MYNRFILIGVIGLLAMLPQASRADSITLDGVSPAVDEDITPPDNQKASEENFYTFWLKGQIGTQYEANFTVSEEPAFTFVSGGDMTLEDNVHYNADDGTFTVTYTAAALQQIDSQSGLELDENQTLTIIAISFPVAEGESGPGEATIGSWLATNFQEWTLTTPSESNNAMGATVQGDAGDTGDFELFMPDSALTLMAEYDGEEAYDAADMAVYKDETQAQAEVENVTGGAYVSFSTTLPEESDTEEPQTLQPLAQGVSQALTVAPIPPITLDVTDSTVNKYDYVKLTGTIKSGKSGKTVTLWRRFEDTKLEKFATVTTTKNGKFKLRLKIRRSILFKAKYKGDVSDSVSVQVN